MRAFNTSLKQNSISDYALGIFNQKYFSTSIMDRFQEILDEEMASSEIHLVLRKI